MTRVNKKCFQLNLGWKRTSRKHFSASAFISRSRPSASTSKMALASKTFSLMSFFNLGFNWKNFSFTLVPFFLTVFYNNFDNKILIVYLKYLVDIFCHHSKWFCFPQTKNIVKSATRNLSEPLQPLVAIERVRSKTG